MSRPSLLGVDRRELQIPVVEVVRDGLVEPLELAGLAVERHGAVGVQPPARRLQGDGRRLVHVPGPEVDGPVGADRRRVPSAARDDLVGHGVGHRVERPDRSAGLGVERVGDAATQQRAGRQVDAPVRDLRLDVDAEAARQLAARLLAGGRDQPGVPPQLASGLGIEGERERGGRSIDDAVRNDDAVGPDVLRVVRARPQAAPAAQVDREDVRLKVLEVHDAVRVGDRVGRERPVDAARR